MSKGGLTIKVDDDENTFEVMEDGLVVSQQNQGQKFHDETWAPVETETMSLSINEPLGISKAVWYWPTVFLSVLAEVVIFAIPSNDVPLVYLRSLLAIPLIMFLPGFAFIQLIFPDKRVIKIAYPWDRILERFVLSVGLSLVLSSLFGLILNYTLFGVRLMPLTLVLLVFTLVLATLAMFRESNAHGTKIS